MELLLLMITIAVGWLRGWRTSLAAWVVTSSGQGILALARRQMAISSNGWLNQHDMLERYGNLPFSLQAVPAPSAGREAVPLRLPGDRQVDAWHAS